MKTITSRLTIAVLASAISAGGALAQQVELTFWSATARPGEAAALAAFKEAHPEIGLNIVNFASQEYKTQLRVTVAGGNTPDVFTTNGGFTFFEYVDRGANLDITDIVAERGWAARTNAEFLAANTDADGRIWGIPWVNMSYWQALFYDKDFFDQHAIPVPMSLDDMADAVPKIREAGRFPIAFGDKDGWPAILMLGDYMLQSTTPAEIAKLNTGEASWPEFEPAIKAFEALRKLASDEAFAPGFLTINHEAAVMAWASERTAMLYNGTWWPKVAGTRDPGFTVGVAPLPMIDPAAPLQGAQYWADIQLVIGSHLEGEQLEAALTFVDFVTSDETMVLFGDAENTITSNPSANQNLAAVAEFLLDETFTRQDDKPKMIPMDHAFPIPVIEVLKVELQKVLQNDGYATLDALNAVEAAHAAERARS